MATIDIKSLKSSTSGIKHGTITIKAAGSKIMASGSMQHYDTDTFKAIPILSDINAKYANRFNRSGEIVHNV